MKNIIISILLTAALAACSSKNIIKEQPTMVSDPVAETPIPKSQPTPATQSSVVETSIEVNPLTDPNNILSKRSVYFDYDNYAVKSKYKNLIKAHAKYLKSHPTASIIIQGNADERGSREYNLALGQKRAAAVKMVLNLLGVPNKQIETISYGNENPKDLGHDEAAWGQNRRADIVYAGE